MISIGAQRHIGATSWVFVNEKSTARSLRLTPWHAAAQTGEPSPQQPLDPRGQRFWRRLRGLGKIEPHGGDPALGDAVDDKLNRPKRKAVADLRLMVHMGREQIRERHCHVVWRDGETVDFAERTERDVARNEKISQQ